MSKNAFEDIGFLDQQIGKLLDCNPLPEDSIKELCHIAREILTNESNVQ